MTTRIDLDGNPYSTEGNLKGVQGSEFDDGELDPYFEGGYWRLPYLMNGAGGFGGGVG